MQLGLSIEEDFISASVLDKTGKGIMVDLDRNQKTEFRAALLIKGNHAYTEDNIHSVKMADPSLPIFDHIVTTRSDRRDQLGRSWHRSQLLAILVKKMLFLTNAQFVDSADQVRLTLADQAKPTIEEDLKLALEANGLTQFSTSSSQDAVRNYLSNTGKGDCDLLRLSQVLITTNDYQAFSKSRLVNLLYRQLITEQGNPVSADFGRYALRHQLEKITHKILQGDKSEAQQLVVEPNLMRLHAPHLDIRALLVDLLRPHVSTLNNARVFCTGRLARYALVREIVEEIKPDGVSVEYDLKNEAQALGLLKYNPQ